MTDSSKPAPGPDDFMVRYAAWEREAATFAPQNKANLFAVLATAGVTKVVVSFNGEGDSGQIEDILAYKGDAACELPETLVEITRLSFWEKAPSTRSLRPFEAIEALAFGFLEETHGGWENYDGAYGEFIFDVAGGSITLEYNERVSSSEFYGHEW